MAPIQSKPSSLIAHLRQTLCDEPPFCSGTIVLSSDMLELYYGRESPSFVDFAQSGSPEGQRSLQELEAACEAAPFGRKQETIIDETYRKAGKMDSRNFMTRFHAEQTGIVDVIRTGLLTGSSEEEGIPAQLYKLNVYGKGAFFKPHVDTPRSQKMFGSLVVVFPTPHEGGQLILRKEDSEWTFDAAQLLSGNADRIAYVAFFSDVEHEVLPVLSGHRVTITYNLYFDNAQSRPKVPNISKT
ncbi:hypothetical protein VTO73DRAFT_14009 [Trametes versicolor]